MTRDTKANKLAFEYHKSGFHCAEAVLTAVTEAFGEKAGFLFLRQKF